MTSHHGLIALALFLSAGAVLSPAQNSGKADLPVAKVAADAASQAEAGQCTQALPLLAKASGHLTDKALEKRVELDGVRCASLVHSWSQLADFVRALERDFPRDPEALYTAVHAWSDLSTHAAEELARVAPASIPALELDAEANEVQGRWDEAEKDYQAILKSDPRYPGIHFRLARLLLSRSNPPPDFQDQAKKELQEELAIDPSNAGAEYVSGELARQMQDLPAAAGHFARARTLDPNFGDAWLGLGMTLLGEKKYEDAIAPLEMAVKLEPGNPAGHYNLATAYARTGHKQEAEREFALQQQTAQQNNPAGGTTPQ
ncbi:MAG: tetratricopeptide repeat protein [Acidobacteriaceae bacterium]